ncbi:mitochondrion biogenesis protein-like protein [Amylocarpus encephaloides]|uniref:Sensitive to high expression protein 9, mitochondrial n=1 Tax=Amylocarpus encephaloides TaxID=45428 RepID=A0A9P7YIU5_9HELO|nr:mitochondrion biogenesis protein-like protein [Amylocarpus encephaloides]
MQHLAHTVPRLLFDPIFSSKASRAIRISSRSSFRPSTCLQCKVQSQTRRYADAPKSPGSPDQSPSPSEKLDSSPMARDETSELPSAKESRRSAATKRLSHLMDNLQGNIFIASQRINDLTGYSGIEELKEKIIELEKRVSGAQALVRSSRAAYKTTVAERAATQREVTGLLARKDTWNPADLERFTALYRMDHSNEQAVQDAATKLADAEREGEHAGSKLSSNILSRYHEEQIWSDKIRRMSTWGTWGLMGVNVLLFLVFQFGFEPWRRRRLVRGFEEKVLEALEKGKLAQAETHVARFAKEVPLDGVIAAGIQQVEGMDSITTSPVPAVGAVMEGELEEEAALDIAEMHKPTALFEIRKPETWQAAMLDLFSKRAISLRMQDVTFIALEGAATGAAIVIMLTSLLRRA